MSNNWRPFAIAFNAEGGNDCGTGAGGFKKGNTCAAGKKGKGIGVWERVKRAVGYGPAAHALDNLPGLIDGLGVLSPKSAETSVKTWISWLAHLNDREMDEVVDEVRSRIPGLQPPPSSVSRQGLNHYLTESLLDHAKVARERESVRHYSAFIADVLSKAGRTNAAAFEKNLDTWKSGLEKLSDDTLRKVAAEFSKQRPGAGKFVWQGRDKLISQMYDSAWSLGEAARGDAESGRITAEKTRRSEAIRRKQGRSKRPIVAEDGGESYGPVGDFIAGVRDMFRG